MGENGKYWVYVLDYFEETKIFSKNTCFFQETLLLYVGTCLEVPFRHVFLRIGGAVNGEV